MKISAHIIILILTLSLSSVTWCQRLPIENFSVDKGLSQTQVTCITQDKWNYLWVGTISGLNRFDGNRFKVFSKKDGLPSNLITALFTSANGNIWIGTSKGLTRYDGYRFKNIVLPSTENSVSFSSITEDESGTLYVLNKWRGLFKLKQDSLEKVILPENLKNPTCLYKDLKGNLWIYVYRSGFYKLQKGRWIKQFLQLSLKENEFVVQMTEVDRNIIAITNNGSILKSQGDNFLIKERLIQGYAFSLNTDNDQEIWIGMAQGVVVLNPDDLSFVKKINAINGLSDNLVYTIYKDRDQILWLGTDADGLFKYSGGPFVKFDKTTGLTGNVVMGFGLESTGNILIGTREGKLLRYLTKQNKFSPIDYSQYSNRGINSIGAGTKDDIYFCTTDNHFLRLKNNTLTELRLEKKMRPSIYSIKSHFNKVLVHTTYGSYWIDGEKVEKVDSLRQETCNSIQLNSTEILIGTMNGLYTCTANNKIKKLKISELDNISISALSRFKDYIVIGSIDEGLFFWHPATNEVIRCDAETGLSDNNVFGIMYDSGGRLWVGTSSGIQRVEYNSKSKSFDIRQYTIAEGYESSESNLDAMIEDAAHHIWIGTTKGAFFYNPALDKNRENSKPVMIIENVEFSRAKNTTGSQYSAWSHLPVSPSLEFANNSIAFTFKGIYLRDPSSLRYSYMLSGFDTGFSSLQKQATLNYKSLPPGKYIFRVKAYTKNGVPSENTFEYPFSIQTPFYKTTWFLLLIIFGLLLTGSLLQFAYALQKRKTARKIREIKEQEKQKIREQTSEDFHDELGNKLTRISVLTEVLQNKIDPGNKEGLEIINQIKANALALYSGTKEIIWSLSKEGNILKDILMTIRQTGYEQCSNTEIEFEFIGLESINPHTTLPAGYSRNLVMIFKELMSNTLRHAHATKISIECQMEDAEKVSIRYSDNGIGYEANSNPDGNGLKNINHRVQKINGSLSIQTSRDNGIKCVLHFRTNTPSKRIKTL